MMLSKNGYVFPLTMTFLLLPLALLGCRKDDAPQTRAAAEVYTTFYATTYFTERIGGDRVKVVCPLPADADPIYWQPDSKAIAAYQAADLIVVNGASFEKWVAKASLPESNVVDTAAPLSAEFIKFKAAGTHSHGSDGGHSHEGIDGHTWLDPHNAKVQAGEIAKALAKLMPEHADEFETNRAALAADLDELDRTISELGEKLSTQHLLASHPAYNYLVARYDWDVTNLDLDPESPSAEDAIAQVRAAIEVRPAKILLWEAEPTPEVAEQLASEFGLISIVFSPCESLDAAAIEAGEDYLTVMRANVERLREALQE